MKSSSPMPMYYGAKPELFEFAKKMHHAPTVAEKLMWEILLSNEFKEYKFRRQHPIARFIADFYSHRLLFVIEVDGGYHLSPLQKEVDAIRDEDMQHLGLTILPFTNNDVIDKSGISINKLQNAIAGLKRESGERFSRFGS